MLIHFAFGQKREDTKEQTNLTIEYILKPRRLKISLECYEFLPILHYPGSGRYSLSMKNAELIENGLRIKINKENPISERKVVFLPEKVPMLCCIKIPFNKLKNSNHQLNYGRLGFVFSDNFIKKNKPRQVLYYEEQELFRDKIILQYNQLSSIDKRTTDQEISLERIRREILMYRKPCKLWPSFANSVVANVTSNPNGKSTLQLWQYDRYPQGYDFSREQEWRIAFDSNTIQYLDFNEEDIRAIIVPDQDAKNKIDEFLFKNYQKKPEILLFPT